MAESISNRFTEFLVDFLGGLVPGLVFSFLALVSFAVPAATLFAIAVETEFLSGDLILDILEAVASFNLAITGIAIVVSYVFGHIFFRQDPKRPDEASYNYVSQGFSPDEEQHWVVQRDAQGQVDIQFPYLYIHEYLQARNMSHLAELVPWRGSDASTHIYRSKQFVNMLKIRLYYYVPEKCGRIIRNEAHIRLISSLWYLTQGLRRVYLVSVFIYVVGIILMFFLEIAEPNFILTIPLLFVALVALASESIRKVVERFFHYQRVREVFYVLETAFIASRDYPEITKRLPG